MAKDFGRWRSGIGVGAGRARTIVDVSSKKLAGAGGRFHTSWCIARGIVFVLTGLVLAGWNEDDFDVLADAPIIPRRLDKANVRSPAVSS